MSKTNDNKKPLTKALFLEKLSIHGADFSRWDNVDAAAAEIFLNDNDSVKDDYEQAKALDSTLSHYKVPSDFKADTIIGVVSDKIAADKVSGIADAKLKAKNRKTGMVYYWGGGMAVAASLILMFLVQNPAPSALPDGVEIREVSSNFRDIESQSSETLMLAALEREEAQLFATWERALAEDLSQREIISLWDTAQATNVTPETSAAAQGTNAQPASVTRSDIAAPQKIDDFIENSYVPLADDVLLENEMNLWELYLASEEHS